MLACFVFQELGILVRSIWKMQFQREDMFETNMVGTFKLSYHIRKKIKLSSKNKVEHCSTPTNKVGLAQQQVFLQHNWTGLFLQQEWKLTPCLAHGTCKNFILNLCFHSFCFSEPFCFESGFVHNGCVLEGFENIVEKLSRAFGACHLHSNIQ